jgi:hypothetical protein
LVSSPAAPQAPPKDPPERIPAFHSTAPKAPLPKTLDSAQFSDVLVKNTYAMAAKVKGVLYQQPCYCNCDLNHAHTSLHDCFVTAHASTCSTCLMEAIFAYERANRGETATAIRKEIIRGDWKLLDSTKYRTLMDIR